MHVMIIGAGTGGMALAHALKRADIGVSVYERSQTSTDEQGGGYRVGISPAGSRALRSCLPPEIYDLFVATCARPPRYFNMLDERFSELLCLEIAGEAPPVDGEKNVVRKTLRQVLLKGLEDQVSFGKKFVSYTTGPDGSVTAQFEDGITATGDVLIGADGAGSRVRKQRLPHARHEGTGIVSIGGQLPMTSATKALLSDKMFEGMSMVMAPRGVGAIIHSLEFAPNRANPDFMARWPEFANAIAHDSIGWGLWAARQNLLRDPLTLGAEDLLRVAEELTVDWHPHMRRIIQMTDPSTTQRLSIRTSVPLSPWESSNVTLLGDAAHTMTPGRGAGANTALRDAVLLCERLVEVQRGKKSLMQSIHEYEVEMLRYSTEAVIASRKQMNSNDVIHKPMIGALQLAAMKGGMRIVNAIPYLKRRVTQKIMRVRGEN